MDVLGFDFIYRIWCKSNTYFNRYIQEKRIKAAFKQNKQTENELFFILYFLIIF